MPRLALVLLFCLGLAPAPVLALRATTLEASVSGGIYRVRFEGLIEAPPERVAGVLTDYAGYAALDPRIRSSGVVGTAPDGVPLLKTRIRACAVFFCRDIRRVERVTLGDDVLVAEALPERSDVRRSVARTEWHAEGDRTRIRYEAEFVPDFWVPAVVSRRYAARMLRDSVLQLFENVEARSREP